MIKLYMNKNFSNLAWKRYRAIQFNIYSGLNSGVETLQGPGGIKTNGGFKQWRSHASGAWGMKYEVAYVSSIVYGARRRHGVITLKQCSAED